jgi:hypothetical protein
MHIMTVEDGSMEANGSIRAELAPVACAIVGLSTLVTALVDAGQLLLSMVVTPSAYIGLGTRIWPQVGTIVLRLQIGLFLLLAPATATRGMARPPGRSGQDRYREPPRTLSG